jgi:hypothetical protein
MALAVEAALLYQLLPLKAIGLGRPKLTGMAASVAAASVVGGGIYLNSVKLVEDEELRNRQPYALWYRSDTLNGVWVLSMTWTALLALA